MNNPSKRRRIVLAIVAVLLVLAIALPISNLLIGRPYLAVQSDDPVFQKFSHDLQTSCADCHTPDLVHKPLYFSFPIASQIISADIKEAQKYLVITQDQLEGKVPFSAPQLAKIRQVVEKHSMPPIPYKAMHWDAGLGSQQQQELLAWTEKAPGGYQPQPIPVDNPFQPNPDKVALGSKLYHDVRLSGDNTVSCATCHSLETGGCDQLAVSTGIRGQQGPINAPTVFNSAFNLAQFWDGRAADLQEQAAGPVANPLEMGANWDDVVKVLAADPEYVKSFEALYAGQITKDTATDAIAEFEKTLLTPNSKFDHFLNGDTAALDEQEQQGHDLFVKHECATCHTGVILGGQSYETMGLVNDYFALRGGEQTDADQGRFNVTHEERDRHKFKVPTLRNVALTAPYFHDGHAKTLDEAVRTMLKVQCGVEGSDQDVAALVRFLESLTGDYDGKLLTDKAPAAEGAPEA